MNIYDIVTVTVNPSIDKSTSFSKLEAEQKISCESPRFDAGGGGVNVSKAIKRLGGLSKCIITSGGTQGVFLEELLELEELNLEAVKIKSRTRENFIAVDRSTNDQYRFGFKGEVISENEKQLILDSILTTQTNFLVLSGSLNEGLGDDFYAQIVSKIDKSKTKVIVDTSRKPLKYILKEGAYLIKPNVVELADLVGEESLEYHQINDAAKKIIKQKGAEIVVVSLGPDGAMIVTADFNEHIKAPKIDKKSTVGAGDSMVGGMVWALSQGKTISEVIRWGVACGTAATMNEGTQLFKIQDAQKIYDSLN